MGDGGEEGYHLFQVSLLFLSLKLVLYASGFMLAMLINLAPIRPSETV